MGILLWQDVLHTMDGISQMLSLGLTQSNKTSIVVTSQSLSVGAVQLNPPGEVAANPDVLGAGNLTVDVAGVLDLAGVDPDEVPPTEVLNVSNQNFQRCSPKLFALISAENNFRCVPFSCWNLSPFACQIQGNNDRVFLKSVLRKPVRPVYILIVLTS